jgi:hypothetical protein
MQENPRFQPWRSKNRAPTREQRTAEAEAPAAQSPSPPAGPSRSAQPSPSQGRAGGSQGGRAQESIFLSDDDEEDVKVKVELYSP